MEVYGCSLPDCLSGHRLKLSLGYLITCCQKHSVAWMNLAPLKWDKLPSAFPGTAFPQFRGKEFMESLNLLPGEAVWMCPMGLYCPFPRSASLKAGSIAYWCDQ